MRDRDLIQDSLVEADRGRFWCSYLELEEFHAGMWKTSLVIGEEVLIAKAVSVLGNEDRFESAVQSVFREWRVSVRAEMTSPGNHQSWIGCAACCLVAGVPEHLTRRAWWKLSEEQRSAANNIADRYASEWLFSNGRKTKQLELFAGAPC